MRVFPFFCEVGGTGADFVPGEVHGAALYRTIVLSCAFFNWHFLGSQT
jgi:hypothetical protein